MNIRNLLNTHICPLAAAIAIIGFSGNALAGPTTFTNQGRLTDGDKTGLEDSHALTFTIYDAETGGSAVWNESQATTFTNGYYSVVLGANTDNPLDGSILTSGALYLELTVDAGSPLSPRHPLNTVPYATVAENLDGGWVDATEISINGNTVVDEEGNWTGGGIDWDSLSNVPGIANLSCNDGTFPLYSYAFSEWQCATAEDIGLGDGDIRGMIQESPLNFAAGTTLDGNPIMTGTDVSWNILDDMPDGFSDNEDNDTLSDLECVSGQHPVWLESENRWTCQGFDTTLVTDYFEDSPIVLQPGSTVDGRAIATIPLDWGLFDPETLPDGLDNGDDLESLECDQNDIARYDQVNDVWECSDTAPMAGNVLGGMLMFLDHNVSAEVNLGMEFANSVAVATISDKSSDAQTNYVLAASVNGVGTLSVILDNYPSNNEEVTVNYIVMRP